jgi:hypothetical protein
MIPGSVRRDDGTKAENITFDYYAPIPRKGWRIDWITLLVAIPCAA